MGLSATSKLFHSRDMITDRYRLEKTIGRGGMADVYQVLDKTSGNRVALKMMNSVDNEEEFEQLSKLFEYEYYILSLLTHPRIIEVYDYGILDKIPFYTMELLEGGNLKHLSPLPWKDVCLLLCDICSALSFLHSRRMLHGDLSPRNVYCTKDKKAKLIDFGTMTPMGPCRHLIGTPAYTSPEIVNQLSLDARSDLFSLGATAYYLLTGHDAYPAKNFFQLRKYWRKKTQSTSGFVANIPKELDKLVLSMISLDYLTRPVSAAEVMERVSSIANFEIDEHIVVSQSYLSTPTLVGREGPLQCFRSKIVDALQGRGATVVVKGTSGSGRSRFLDACILEGKLLSINVVKSDVADSHVGNWGVASTLVRQLYMLQPKRVQELAEPLLPVLGHVVPTLLWRPAMSQESVLNDRVMGLVLNRRFSSNPPSATSEDPKTRLSLRVFSSPEEKRSQIHAALIRFFIDFSHRSCLIIAVDDIDNIDEPSASFLALLSNETQQHKIVFITTTLNGLSKKSSPALDIIENTATIIPLEELTSDGTIHLLSSVFGDVRNLNYVAKKVSGVSGGNPRAIMQITQYLLDQGMVRYRAGSWILPDRLNDGDLPNSLKEAMRERFKRFSVGARQIAETLVCVQQMKLGFEEIAVLSEHRQTGELIHYLDELVTAEVLVREEGHYTFSHLGWAALIQEDMANERSLLHHLRIANMYEKFNLDPGRAIWHYFSAKKGKKGLVLLLDYFKQEGARILQGKGSAEDINVYLRHLDQWSDILQSALDIWKDLSRPQLERFLILRILLRVHSLKPTVDITKYITELIDRCCYDCGLDIYQQLDDSLPPDERLIKALELCQERYNDESDLMRVFDPGQALQVLVETIVTSIGFAINTYNCSLIEALPRLEAFFPLSSDIIVVDRFVRAVRAVMTHRLNIALEIYRDNVELLSSSEMKHLQDRKSLYMSSIYALAILESDIGMQKAKYWADELEQDPMHEVNAWQVREIYYINQGDTTKAEECKNKVETLRIQKNPVQDFEDMHLRSEVIAYAHSDDLVGIKDLIPRIQKHAEEFDGWIPILRFARGEYERIRGDCTKALDEIKVGLKKTAAGTHMMWTFLVESYLKILLEQEDYSNAKTIGQQFLNSALEANLDYGINLIQMPLGLALAKLGEFEVAVEKAENVISTYEGQGVTGVNLGCAYENRARIAITMKDIHIYNRYARQCADQYREGNNPALFAKYEKLARDAWLTEIEVNNEITNSTVFQDRVESEVDHLMATVFRQNQSQEERMTTALDLVVKNSHSAGALLYTIRNDQLLYAAKSGDYSPFPELDRMANNFLSKELKQMRTVTGTESVDDTDTMTVLIIRSSEMGDDLIERYQPLIMGHNTPEDYLITGVVVLIRDPSRSFIYPAALTTSLSKNLFSSGDAISVFGFTQDD